MNKQMLKNEIKESIQVKTLLNDSEAFLNKVIEIAQACLDSLERGGKIIFVVMAEALRCSAPCSWFTSISVR